MKFFISLITILILVLIGILSFIYIYKKVSADYEKKLFELGAVIEKINNRDNISSLPKIKISLTDLETIKTFLYRSDYDEVEWNDPINDPQSLRTVIFYKDNANEKEK